MTDKHIQGPCWKRAKILNFGISISSKQKSWQRRLLFFFADVLTSSRAVDYARNNAATATTTKKPADTPSAEAASAIHSAATSTGRSQTGRTAATRAERAVPNWDRPIVWQKRIWPAGTGPPNCGDTCRTPSKPNQGNAKDFFPTFFLPQKLPRFSAQARHWVQPHPLPWALEGRWVHAMLQQLRPRPQEDEVRVRPAGRRSLLRLWNSTTVSNSTN